MRSTNTTINEILNTISNALANVAVSLPTESVSVLPWATCYAVESEAEIISGALTAKSTIYEVMALVSRTIMPQAVTQANDLHDGIIDAIITWAKGAGIEIPDPMRVEYRSVNWGGVVYYGVVIRVAIKEKGGYYGK